MTQETHKGEHKSGALDKVPRFYVRYSARETRGYGMAGRLGFFEYNSDNAAVYIIQQDRSNGLVVGNVLASPGGTKLPGTVIEPRYLTLEAPNPVVGLAPLRRKIVVGDPSAANWQNPPATYLLDVVGGAAIPFAVTGAVGERRTDLQQF